MILSCPSDYKNVAEFVRYVDIEIVDYVAYAVMMTLDDMPLLFQLKSGLVSKPLGKWAH